MGDSLNHQPKPWDYETKPPSFFHSCLAINLRTLLGCAPEPLLHQYVYQAPPLNSSVTLSDLFSTGRNTLLVPERGTDKLFQIDVSHATDITPFEDASGRLLLDPTKTLEQLTSDDLSAMGIDPVSKSVVVESLTAIDPLLEKCEGVCLVGRKLVFTYDNDFNVAEAASIPANPSPQGPFVQIELVGNNLPKLFVVPLP